MASNATSKKKKKNQKKKQTGPIIIQLSENDNGGKTTDVEQKKPQSGKKTVMTMPSFTGDESDTISIKMTQKQPVKTIDSDEDSFDDNDFEFEDDFNGKDKPNPVPSKPIVKFTEQPSKTDHLLSKKQPQKAKPQQKQKPLPKKKAGAEMKAKVYSMETPADSGISHTGSIETSIASLRDNFDFSSGSRTPQFYDTEKINEIHNFLTNVTIHIKNNPFYMFATETATSIGKMNETMFIHSSVQDIIRIITANGKLDTSMSDYHKRFNMYSNTIKNMMSLIKTFGNVPQSLLDSSSYGEQIVEDHLFLVSETQKAIHDSFKSVKVIQNEMEILKKILISANPYLSSKFYFSSTLIALVNTAIVEIQNMTDSSGIVNTTRKYDPEKIIALRPDLRNQLAQLCAHIYNRNNINTGQRYVSDREARRNLAAVQNMTLVMKKALEQDDDMLADNGAMMLSTPVSSSLIVPQMMQYSQESIFEPPSFMGYSTPSSSSQQQYLGMMMPQTTLSPPAIPEYGSPSVSQVYGTPTRIRSSAKKRGQSSSEFYVPSKYLRF